MSEVMRAMMTPNRWQFAENKELKYPSQTQATNKGIMWSLINVTLAREGYSGLRFEFSALVGVSGLPTARLEIRDLEMLLDIPTT
jgi:hypothetical protein